MDIDVKLGEKARMPDGVDLSADVYTPVGDGEHAAVLIRSPYDTRSLFHVTLARYLALNGFVTVVQAVRGRAPSTGEFTGLSQETRDAPHVARWLAEQEWFPGRLCPVGFSYGSLCAFAVAAEALELGITVPCVINVFGGLSLDPCVGGALRMHWALPLSIIVGHGTGAKALRRRLKEEPDVFERLDLRGIDLGSEVSNRVWRAFIDEPPPGVDARYFKHVPTLSLTGWYDFMVDVTFRTHRALVAASPGGSHALIVGPWNHHEGFREITAAILGKGAFSPVGPVSSIPAAILAWLRQHTGRGAAGEVIEPGVHYLVTGRDAWGHVSVWDADEKLPLYLARGDGGRRRSLAETPPPEARVAFSYDPLDPVPTIGGSIWPLQGLFDPGPADQSPLEGRGDVVLYDSEPLVDRIEVVGDVALDLWLDVTSSPADVAVKLVDVRPDGYAAIVADSIVRLKEGAPERRRLPLIVGVVAHRFDRGHRVRLEVAPSNFPKYDRAMEFRDGRPVIARYTLYEGGSDPSCLRFPRR